MWTTVLPRRHPRRSLAAAAAALPRPRSRARNFQHGLLPARRRLLLLPSGSIAAGLGVAAIWIRLGTSSRRRALESLALCALAAAAIFAPTRLRGSWDLSENRANSFSLADAKARALVYLLSPSTSTSTSPPRTRAVPTSSAAPSPSSAACCPTSASRITPTLPLASTTVCRRLRRDPVQPRRPFGRQPLHYRGRRARSHLHSRRHPAGRRRGRSRVPRPPARRPAQKAPRPFSTASGRPRILAAAFFVRRSLT